MRARRLLLALLVSAVASCNTITQRPQGRVGQTRDQLLSELGAPDHSALLGDGREVLTWIKLRRETGAYCRTNCTASAEGVVENVSCGGCGTQIFTGSPLQ